MFVQVFDCVLLITTQMKSHFFAEGQLNLNIHHYINNGIYFDDILGIRLFRRRSVKRLHSSSSHVPIRIQSLKMVCNRSLIPSYCATQSMGAANQLFANLIQTLLTVQCSISPPEMWPCD